MSSTRSDNIKTANYNEINPHLEGAREYSYNANIKRVIVSK